MAPTKSPIQAFFEQLHRRFANLAAGHVVSHVPELAQDYEVGDTYQPRSSRAATWR